MDPTDSFQNLSLYLPNNEDLVRRLLLSLAIAAILLLARWLFLRLLRRSDPDPVVAYRWNKASSYLTSLLALFLIGSLWLDGISDLATFLGLIGAGLAVALREPIANIAGWAFILWRRPFELNDRVEIDGVRGDVVDQRIFAFSLMEIGNWVDAEQSTGRIVHIPNAHVFTKHLANYTQGFEYIWHEIAVVVTFESDWQKAKDLLTGIVEEHAFHITPQVEMQLRRAAQRFMIAIGALTPKVYTRVVDIGVELTMRFLIRARQRRGVEEAIWEDVLRAFAAEPDIDFAYPTQRIYFNPQEGKPGSGGPPES